MSEEKEKSVNFCKVWKKRKQTFLNRYNSFEDENLFEIKNVQITNKLSNTIYFRKYGNVNDKELNDYCYASKYRKDIAKLFILLYNIIIVINLITSIISLKINQINLYSSYITIKIKGIGISNIFYRNYRDHSSYFVPPDEVIINSISQIEVKSDYYFNETENEIKLSWNKEINSTHILFMHCSNITEIDLSNFNSSQVTNMSSMFHGCKSLTSINFRNFDTSKTKTLGCMFYDCSSLTSLDLSSFKTSQVALMQGVFYNCFSLETLYLSNFDTTQVRYMNKSFYNCSKLTILDLSNFKTSNVEDMEEMFRECSKLNSLNLSNFDTSKVTLMHYMFDKCSSLSILDISNFNTSKVENMIDIFRYCSSLKSLNLSNFDTSEVTNMWGMFAYCSELIIVDLSSFNTKKVTSMGHMFDGCKSLTSLNLSNFDTSNVINMEYMFNECEKLPSLNLSNFNTSNVNNMLWMFRFCYKLSSLNISNFNTSKVRNMRSMFLACKSLTSLNISNFDTSQVETMFNMFSNCLSLISLNISNFNTSKTNNINQMFCACPKLEFLDISSFDTSKIVVMNFLFSNCSSLISLDLSNFNTSEVISMKNMFYYCKSLKYLNINNFDTSKVTNFDCIFEGCSSLTSLNISNFNTSNVIIMHRMFYECSSLTSLDLSNFNTANVGQMNSMFQKCYSLVSLNLSSFYTPNVYFFQWMFNGSYNLEYINMENFDDSHTSLHQYGYHINNFLDYLPDNLVVCIKGNNNLIRNKLNSFKCHVIDCSNDWKLRQKKLIKINESCINNCNIKDEYNKIKCYENCTNGYLMNSNSFFNICKCDLDSCLLYTNSELNEELCNKLNHNFYPIQNDIINIEQYINCYKNPDGYYLDKDVSIYKKCFESCETCKIKGDNKTHNCLKCNFNYSIDINYNNYINCYKKCEYNYYIDNEFTFYCTNNDTCPNEYNKYIPKKNRCIYNCNDDDIYKYEYNNKCYKECPIIDLTISNNIDYYCEAVCNKEYYNKNIKVKYCLKNCDINEIEEISCTIKNLRNKTKSEKENKKIEIEEKNKLIKSVDSSMTSQKFNTSKVDSGEDITIQDDKMTITITTTENQKNNSENNNITVIDLGECETELRKFYNISNGKLIYMKKIDVIQEEMKIPKVEFDVYCKLYGQNLIKLNKSVCEKTKINIEVPVVIIGNIDKLNTSSRYFNDICYLTTSDDGTDMTLEDRKKKFINNKEMVCQDDCDFTEYDYNLKKAKCSCKVKETSLSFADMNVDTDQFFKNLKNIKQLVNIDILYCYKVLFKIKDILSNIGCFIMAGIIIFNLICIFIFYYSNQIDKIKILIDDIVLNIINNQLKLNKDIKKEKLLKKKKTNRKNGIISRKNNKSFIQINKLTTNNYNIKVENIKYKSNEMNIINTNNNTKVKNIIYNSNKKNIINSNKYKTSIEESINKKFIDKVNKVMEYTDEELNSLEYNLAIQYDKRTYFQYYISLLKTKHSFIFSFFNNNDYNSKIIKINLFFISFSIYYGINSFFFNDDTMHKIYESHGTFDLGYQLPQIIYSSLISILLNTILKLFSLSSDDICSLKQRKSKNDIKKVGNELFEKLKIKFGIYFFIGFIFLIFFWYYLSMFCAIYRNTQIHLIKDTLISFGLSFIYPFGIYFIPGIFRIPALSDPKKNKKYLYQFSSILQMI